MSSCARATVEALTGARIDDVVVTDFTGFVRLVDQIGPVAIDSPVPSVATDDRARKFNCRRVHWS